MSSSCPECGGRARQQDVEQHGCCFRCKIGGLSFQFVGGGGYGRQNFHDRTTAEVQREIVDSARKEGRDIQLQNGTYTGPGKL